MKNGKTLTKTLVAIFILGIQVNLFAQEAAKKDSADVFNLSLETLLNTDVTTVSKSAEKQSDAPGIISVLTKDELQRFGGTTLKDILNRIPGLTTSSAYFTDRSMIAARGDQVKVSSGHVLLLVNGRPVREILEGGVSSEMFESFPIDIIERIEVVKGPGSVLYGSDAFSAVINVITEKAEKTGVSLTGLIGNKNAYETSGTINIKNGDLNVVVSGRYLKKADWESNYLFNNTATNQVDNLKIDESDKGTGAYLGANYKGLSLTAAYADWQNWYQFNGAIGPNKWNKSFANLGYNHKVFEQWNSDLNVTYTNSKMDGSGSAPFVKRNSNDIVAEWTNFIDLSKKSKLIIGGLFNSRNGKETNYATGTPITSSDSSQTGFQLYAQMDYRLLKSLKLIGGFQVNKMKAMDAGLVPRIGLIWYPISRINVKALYSSAYRVPSINELSLSDPFLHGSPKLKPEYINTIDIGVSYQGEQVQVGVDYFQSKETDIIRSDFSKGLPGIYVNQGTVDIHGFEFEGKYYVNTSLYLNGSLLYQENKDETGEYNVTPVANLGTKAGISYASEKGVIISLFDIYQGNLNNRFRNTINPQPGAYNLLDLHAKLDINKIFSMQLKQKIAIIIQVDNLLDKKYYIPEWGGTNQDAVPGTTGRNIYAGLNLTF